MNQLPTLAQLAALRAADGRERGNVCPIVGRRGVMPRGAAQTALLQALYRRGWADRNGGIPVITDAGRAIVRLTPTA